MARRRPIFGVGLSRTGTTSLAAALTQLNIKTCHYPHDATTQSELINGSELSVLRSYEAVVDISTAPFFRQLDALYPDAAFILTLRDEDAWIDSMERHLQSLRERWDRLSDQFRAFTLFVSRLVYGSTRFDESRLRAAYKAHNNSVLEYFGQRTSDLLVMRISDGDGWDTLCRFLQVSVPPGAFPHENATRSGWDVEDEWHDRSRAAAADIDRNLPENVTVALVDGAMLRDIPRPLIRRTSEAGTYAGPPANEREAIKWLIDLKRGEASYLVVTWPTYWLFDHYPEFTRSIQDAEVSANERVRLFALDEIEEERLEASLARIG